MKPIILTILFLGLVGCFNTDTKRAKLDINGKAVYCKNWQRAACGMDFRNCDEGKNYSCRMNQKWEIVK